MDINELADWVAEHLNEADGGVVPMGRHILVFGTRSNMKPDHVRTWLKKKGYWELGFATASTDTNCWVMVAHCIIPIRNELWKGVLPTATHEQQNEFWQRSRVADATLEKYQREIAQLKVENFMDPANEPARRTRKAKPKAARRKVAAKK